MPRDGYRTICVTDEVYTYIKKKAEQTNRTIPEYIKHLIENDTKTAPQTSPQKQQTQPRIGLYMPAEIIQTNGRIAEVRFICDQCREIIGTQLMLNKEAQAQTKNQVICRSCQQTNTPKKRKHL